MPICTLSTLTIISMKTARDYSRAFHARNKAVPTLPPTIQKKLHRTEKTLLQHSNKLYSTKGVSLVDFQPGYLIIQSQKPTRCLLQRTDQPAIFATLLVISQFKKPSRLQVDPFLLDAIRFQTLENFNLESYGCVYGIFGQVSKKRSYSMFTVGLRYF